MSQIYKKRRRVVVEPYVLPHAVSAPPFSVQDVAGEADLFEEIAGCAILGDRHTVRARKVRLRDHCGVRDRSLYQLIGPPPPSF
jgi:hypothetical protein